MLLTIFWNGSRARAQYLVCSSDGGRGSAAPRYRGGLERHRRRVLSCVSLRSFKAIAVLEDKLSRPVVTTNQAVIWACGMRPLPRPQIACRLVTLHVQPESVNAPEPRNR